MPIYKMDGSKDGKQKYRVRINYTDVFGKARQIERVAYGNAEAKDLERRLIAEMKTEGVSKNRLTVKTLYDEYMRAKQYEVRESTVKKSKTILERYVLPTFGDTQLSKLTAPALNEWKNKIEEIRINSDGKPAPLKIKSKKNIYGEFRALLGYAVKMDYIPKNPLTKVGNFKTSDFTKSEMQYYTPDEFKKYIAAAKNIAENAPALITWDYYVFFNIAFFTGMRKGEIHALRWSDIQNNIISVTKSINQKLSGGDRETPPKNKSSVRTLQIPAPLIKILNDHKKRVQNLKDFSENWHICGGERSLRDTSIENFNKKCAAAAGVKHIRIHDFRHSHASLLANNGINIQEIARRLGHAKIEMTWNTYAHLYPREEERAIEILNKI